MYKVDTNKILKYFYARNRIIFQRLSLGILFGLITLYVVAYGYYAHNIINPDGVSYISIAQQYANGSFGTAINAYWSPLLSWLMVPFIMSGLDGQEAFMSVNIAAALTALIFGFMIVRKTTNNNFYSGLIYLLIVGQFLVKNVGTFITPDMLVVAWAMVFLFFLIKAGELPFYKKTNKNEKITAVVLGVIGALGYTIKLFLLPYFIFTLVVWGIWRFFEKKKGIENVSSNLWMSLRLPVYAIALMMVFASPWIVSISFKYNELMIGSAYSYTVAAKNPNYRGQPQTYQLLPPVSEYAYDAWEDPTLLPYEKFTPTDGTASLLAYGKNRLSQVFVMVDTLNKISSFIIPTTIAVLVLLILKRIRLKRDNAIALTALSAVTYILGYMAIASKNERYMWPVLFGFAVLVAALFFKASRNSSHMRTVFALACVLVVPILIYRTYKVDVPIFTEAPFSDPLRTQALAIKNEEIVGKSDRIAGTTFGTISAIGYYLDAQSHGTIDKKRKNDITYVQDTLNKHRIEFFIPVTDKNTLKKYLTLGQVLYSEHLPGYCGTTNVDDCYISVIKINS